MRLCAVWAPPVRIACIYGNPRKNRLGAAALTMLGAKPVTAMAPAPGATVALVVGAKPVNTIDPTAGLTTVPDTMLGARPVNTIAPPPGATTVPFVGVGARPVKTMAPTPGATTPSMTALGAAPVNTIDPTPGLTTLLMVTVGAKPVATIAPAPGLTAVSTVAVGAKPVTTIEPTPGAAVTVVTVVSLTKFAGMASWRVPVSLRNVGTLPGTAYCRATSDHRQQRIDIERSGHRADFRHSPEQPRHLRRQARAGHCHADPGTEHRRAIRDAATINARRIAAGQAARGRAGGGAEKDAPGVAGHAHDVAERLGRGVGAR